MQKKCIFLCFSINIGGLVTNICRNFEGTDTAEPSHLEVTFAPLCKQQVFPAKNISIYIFIVKSLRISNICCNFAP